MYRLITVCSYYLAVMCIYVIYKAAISSNIWASQAKKAAIEGKLLLLSVQSHLMGEKTRSALRREQGWTHLLRWWFQSLVTQVCMKQSVN
jgi:hypothetical protein